MTITYHQTELKSSLNNHKDIFGWLGKTVVPVMWADPICGDGVCEQGIEMQGFGEHGGEKHLSACPADCGYYPFTNQILITIESLFYSDQEKTRPNGICVLLSHSVMAHKESSATTQKIKSLRPCNQMKQGWFLYPRVTGSLSFGPCLVVQALHLKQVDADFNCKFLAMCNKR